MCNYMRVRKIDKPLTVGAQDIQRACTQSGCQCMTIISNLDIVKQPIYLTIPLRNISYGARKLSLPVPAHRIISALALVDDRQAASLWMRQAYLRLRVLQNNTYDLWRMLFGNVSYPVCCGRYMLQPRVAC